MILSKYDEYMVYKHWPETREFIT